MAVSWNLLSGNRKEGSSDGANYDLKRFAASAGECRSNAGGDADVIIVGAGVAGSALAYTLDCVEEINAQKVFGYALFKDGKSTRISYPRETFHEDVSGRGFHNGSFIQRLREKAASLPRVRIEQGSVTSLLEENGMIKGVQYRKRKGEELNAYAPLTIVCDGCFSNIRRSLCKPKIDVPSSFVGLVLENCSLPFANHGHVILGDSSPVLLYPISSTEVRCLVDVPGKKLHSLSNGELAKYLKTVLAESIEPCSPFLCCRYIWSLLLVASIFFTKAHVDWS